MLLRWALGPSGALALSLAALGRVNVPGLSQEMPSIAEMLAQFFKRPKLVTGFNVQSTVRWVHLNCTKESKKWLMNFQVSTWSPWSSCSKSCGFGEIERKRSVTRGRSPRGSACPVLHQREPCNEFHCQVVVNIITRNAVSNGIMEDVQVDLRIGSTSLPRLNTNSNGQGQTSPRFIFDTFPLELFSF